VLCVHSPSFVFSTISLDLSSLYTLLEHEVVAYLPCSIKLVEFSVGVIWSCYVMEFDSCSSFVIICLLCQGWLFRHEGFRFSFEALKISHLMSAWRSYCLLDFSSYFCHCRAGRF
jgi:hypothetical protein